MSLRLILLCAVFGLTACATLPPTPSEAELIGKERRTWELYAAGDTKGLEALTADDYVDVYPDGTIVDKTAYLSDVGSVKVKSYALEGFKVIRSSADSAVVIYTARPQGVVNGREIQSEVAVTSVWARRGSEWRNVFYRENVLELNGQRLIPRKTAP